MRRYIGNMLLMMVFDFEMLPDATARWYRVAAAAAVYA